MLQRDVARPIYKGVGECTQFAARASTCIIANSHRQIRLNRMVELTHDDGVAGGVNWLLISTAAAFRRQHAIIVLRSNTPQPAVTHR